MYIKYNVFILNSKKLFEILKQYAICQYTYFNVLLIFFNAFFFLLFTGSITWK